MLLVGGKLRYPRSRIIDCNVLIANQPSFSAAFIPLWIIPDSFSSLAAGAFCIQFGVQGAWGVVRLYYSLKSLQLALTRIHHPQIPIQLAELSPPAFRATFPGVAYQLGNVSHSHLRANFPECRSIFVF